MSRVAKARRFTENATRVGSAEGSRTMTGTINKHIRIEEELWKRLETAARERETTANRLISEIARQWLETREWPQSELQARVARASLFAAQAIALDMIAAGRKKEVDDILEHVDTIVPDVAPEASAEQATASEGPTSSRGNT